MPPRRSATNTVRIIDAIDKPLGFYVLSLLIVETFLGMVLVGSNLEPDKKFYGLLIGVGMFVLLVVVVTAMAIFCPHNLVYDKDAHAAERKTPPYGTESRTLLDEGASFPQNSNSNKVA